MDNREKTLQYAIPFTAWDLRLFLDTHPNDSRALNTYRQFCAQCESDGGTSVFRNYAVLPESETDSGKWHWTEGPWPWEYGANRGKGEN